MKKIVLDVELSTYGIYMSSKSFDFQCEYENNYRFITPEIPGLEELMNKVTNTVHYEDMGVNIGRRWGALVIFEQGCKYWADKNGIEFKSIIPSGLELNDTPFTRTEDGRILVNGTYIYDTPNHLKSDN
jgi:hypothetical protein